MHNELDKSNLYVANHVFFFYTALKKLARNIQSCQIDWLTRVNKTAIYRSGLSLAIKENVSKKCNLQLCRLLQKSYSLIYLDQGSPWKSALLAL